MKKLAITLIFTSFLSYGQVDYKSLVKNLDEITVKTELSTFFKGLPFNENSVTFSFYDERFLRFYGIIIDQVVIGNNYDNERELQITLFNEVEDYKIIKTKFNEKYGQAKFVDKGVINYYIWKSTKQTVLLGVIIEDGKFKSFDSLSITFNQ